jgi:type IV pilus assembly protein PilE
MPTSRLTNGFSLIDLLISIGIVSILAAIAYPNYQQSVVLANKAAAKAYLLEISSLQSQYLMENLVYASSLDSLAITPNPPVLKHYSLKLTAVSKESSPPTYTIRAIPKNESPQLDAGVLWINYLGQTSHNWSH